MSIGLYRGQVVRLTKDDADLQKKISQQTAKIVALNGDIGSIQRGIQRSTTSSSLQMKLRQIESKQKDLARAQDALADLQRQRANKVGDLNRSLQSLERAEGQEQKKLDDASKKRHDEGLRRAKEITREVERQRRLHTEMSRSPLMIDLAKLPPKISVLFLAANPLDTMDEDNLPLRLDEEVRSIQMKIRASEHRDAVEPISRWAVRTDDLLQSLNEHRPHIVHFSGHGTPDGDLVFQNDDGSSRLVSKAAIAATMKTMVQHDHLRLIIFNACFSDAQAKAVTQHIDCAIGMNTEIGDDAARTFAAQFYSAIGFGLSIQTAFDQAKAALMMEGTNEEETPELYVRPGVDPTDIILVRP